MSSEHIESNRCRWDERDHHHLTADVYDVDAFRRRAITPSALERREVDDVAGHTFDVVYTAWGGARHVKALPLHSYLKAAKASTGSVVRKAA